LDTLPKTPPEVDRRNLLEWLKSIGFPDSTLTLVIASFGAITLMPYLGGRVIWSVGSNPITIPPIEADSFWIIVTLTPFLWSLIFVRIFGASLLRLLIVFALTATVSFATITLHKYNPVIALNSLPTKCLPQLYSYDFNKNKDRHLWTIKSIKNGDRKAFSQFRTLPISLGNDIKEGYALHIDKIEIEATGFGIIDGLGGFDLEIYIGTFNEQEELIDYESENLITPPENSEVKAKIVLHIEESTLNKAEVRKTVPNKSSFQSGRIRSSVSIDFINNKIEASPKLDQIKEAESRDIYVKGKKPKLQIVGWTRWGSPCMFSFYSINVRLHGRLESGFWF